MAHGEQALRDIDGVIEEARADLGRKQAEQYRNESRRAQLGSDLDGLGSRIAAALAEGREDLAPSGIARQIDLEALMKALDALRQNVVERIATASSALKAAGAARQDAQARLDLL